MGKKRKTKQNDVDVIAYHNLLDAVQSGSVSRATEALTSGADLSRMDLFGFTPLHRLVTNEDIPSNATCKLIKLLVSHGADPNAKSNDGRSVLFLAAEFQKQKAAIETLLEAGADPDVTDRGGTHITENARSKVVRKLLESITAKQVSKQKKASKKERPLSSSQWASARKRISKVFAELESKHVLCMHKIGTTQDDGLADCNEEIQRRGGLKKARIIGCCFYTGQDYRRCRSQGILLLAFWAAPAGKNKDMLKIGRLIVNTFRESGFNVEWNETADHRPLIWLHHSGA